MHSSPNALRTVKLLRTRTHYVLRALKLPTKYTDDIQYDSRDDDYGDDNQSSVNSPTTEGGSVQQATNGDGGADAEAAMAGNDDQQSISSYADDFADDEESVTPQAADTAAPPSNSLETSCDSSRSTRSGDFQAEDQDVNPPPDDSVPVAPAAEGPATDAPVPDAPTAGAPPPAMLTGSDEKAEGRDAGSTASSDERKDDQRRLDNPEGIPAGDNSNNNNSSGDEAVSDFSSQAHQPSRRADDDNDYEDIVSVGDVGGGAAQHEDGDSSSTVSPTSVKGRLEERLRAAEAENDKLRLAAVEHSAGGQPADGGGGKELEMLRSQVEAARLDKSHSLFQTRHFLIHIDSCFLPKYFLHFLVCLTTRRFLYVGTSCFPNCGSCCC